MTNDLSGTTALVTGGGRGIGRGIALRLGAAGALVAVNYADNAEAAKNTVETIESAGGRAFAVKARIGEPSAIETLVATLDAELAKRTGESRLDILINNIGRAEYGLVATTTPEIFDRAIVNNLRNPFFLTQALLPRLRDGGRVISVSTAGTRIAGTEYAAYCIAKAGLEMFTHILAKELGPRRITVNAVAPGYVRTDQVAATVNDPVKAKMLEDMTLFGRIADPDDIADFVYALASTSGRWVTGERIEVGGGFRM